MSDLANDAVTGASKEAFTDFRKLTACGIALATGGAGAAAAVAADKSVFQKALDYAVGNGIITGEDAVERRLTVPLSTLPRSQEKLSRKSWKRDVSLRERGLVRWSVSRSWEPRSVRRLENF